MNKHGQRVDFVLLHRSHLSCLSRLSLALLCLLCIPESTDWVNLISWAAAAKFTLQFQRGSFFSPPLFPFLYLVFQIDEWMMRFDRLISTNREVVSCFRGLYWWRLTAKNKRPALRLVPRITTHSVFSCALGSNMCTLYYIVKPCLIHPFSLCRKYV